MKPALLLIPALLAATGVTAAALSESGDAYVARVIDGDTVVLGNGTTLRLLGIDAPEADEPCGQRATEALRNLVEHRVVNVTNPDQVRDEDKYGRELGYLDTDTDPATTLLTKGLAIARYDSRDGYDRHPRQPRYRAIDAATPAACPALERNSRRYADQDGHRKRLKEQRRARKQRAERRAERREEQRRKAERRAEEQRRKAERRAEEQRREAERRAEEREPEQYDDPPAPEQPDGGYTGPRCYGPGGTTWVPC